MKKIAWALAFLTIATVQVALAARAPKPSPPPVQPAPVGGVVLAGVEHTYATLLIGRGANPKRAARLLAEQAVPTRDMLDVAATLLWQGCTGRRGVDDVAQVSLVAALGAASDTRYWNVLLDCAEQAEHKKVRDKANQVLDQLPNDEVPQFKGSAIRLESVRKALVDAQARDAALRTGKTLQGIARGQSLEEVYARLGLPDGVQLVSIQFSGILASWDTLGSITFRAVPGDHGAWQVASIAVAGAQGDARSVLMRQWLATRDPRVLSRVAKELVTREEYDRAVLDEVARRIDRDFDTGDEHLAGGLSRLCKALGASGDGRYREFLLDIANLATSRRLRSHAQAAAGKLPDGDPDPY